MEMGTCPPPPCAGEGNLPEDTLGFFPLGQGHGIRDIKKPADARLLEAAIPGERAGYTPWAHKRAFCTAGIPEKNPWNAR